jgi:hypothetical protein
VQSRTDLDVSFRTDKAVLAVNGFAADGNMFVKKVRQRLEVSSLIVEYCSVVLNWTEKVVSSRALEGHAYPRNRTPDSDYALFAEILPLLCIQHSWRD